MKNANLLKTHGIMNYANLWKIMNAHEIVDFRTDFKTFSKLSENGGHETGADSIDV